MGHGEMMHQASESPCRAGTNIEVKQSFTIEGRIVEKVTEFAGLVVFELCKRQSN